jgi:hypothetical protein
MGSTLTSWDSLSTEATHQRVTICSSETMSIEVIPLTFSWFSREAVPRNHLPPPCLQNQVPWKLFPTPRQPWMRQYQQNLRLLRWMQEAILNQNLENLHWLLQLSPSRSPNRRQNTLHARRTVARTYKSWTNPKNNAAHWRTGHRYYLSMSFMMLRFVMRSALVRSRQRCLGMGRKWTRSFVRVQSWDHIGLFEEAWARLDLPRALSKYFKKVHWQGCRRWIWILLQKAVGYTLFRPKLLWRIRQRRFSYLLTIKRCNDDCWR